MKKGFRFCALGCVAAVLASSMLMGFASASVKSSSKVPWNKNKKDTVVISVINNYYTAGEKQLAKNYMKLHPETTVKVDVVASNDAYMTKLKTTMTTDINTAPDIVHANFAEGVLGSWTASYSKHYIKDLTSLLKQKNPYNGNKTVGSVFTSSIITRAISNAQGKLGFLPFDYCGVGFFYNKTVFDKYKLKVPTTFENFVSVLKTLKSKGYSSPIVASGVAEWFECMIGDVVYRNKITSLMVQPSDAVWDNSTCSGNKKIKYSPTNASFDLTAVMNDERIKAFIKKNGYNNKNNLFVWSKFAQIAKYFQPNWIASADADDVTQFEAQKSPIMANGSWEVGTIVSDLKKVSKSKQFKWGTFTLPNFKSSDNGGYNAKMRSLYVFGNCMGIIPKNNTDHEKRVEDILKYWYSPKEAQMMYDVTLKSGNLVQGPPAMKGVKLSSDNALRLNGFVSPGSINQSLGNIVGQTTYLQADQATYQSIINQLSAGKISADSFLKQLDPIAMKSIDHQIQLAGYDLNPKTKDTPAS